MNRRRGFDSQAHRFAGDLRTIFWCAVLVLAIVYSPEILEFLGRGL